MEEILTFVQDESVKEWIRLENGAVHITKDDSLDALCVQKLGMSIQEMFTKLSKLGICMVNMQDRTVLYGLFSKGVEPPNLNRAVFHDLRVLLSQPNHHAYRIVGDTVRFRKGPMLTEFVRQHTRHRWFSDIFNELKLAGWYAMEQTNGCYHISGLKAILSVGDTKEKKLHEEPKETKRMRFGDDQLNRISMFETRGVLNEEEANVLYKRVWSAKLLGESLVLFDQRFEDVEHFETRGTLTKEEADLAYRKLLLTLSIS
jgi:hypothetical protein